MVGPVGHTALAGRLETQDLNGARPAGFPGTPAYKKPCGVCAPEPAGLRPKISMVLVQQVFREPQHVFEVVVRAPFDPEPHERGHPGPRVLVDCAGGLGCDFAEMLWAVPARVADGWTGDGCTQPPHRDAAKK